MASLPREHFDNVDLTGMADDGLNPHKTPDGRRPIAAPIASGSTPYIRMRGSYTSRQVAQTIDPAQGAESLNRRLRLALALN